MKVRDLMQARLLTIWWHDSWATAGQLMLWAGIRHLPVVGNGQLLGVVSERDLLAARARGDLAKAVGEDLKAPVQTVHPDEDGVEVAARMATAKQDCFPVVETGKLVGIITTTDLLGAVVQSAFRGESGLTGIVWDVMTPDPACVSFDDPLLDAASRMSQLGVRHLPVVDADRRVIGIVSDRDIRTALGERLARSEEKSSGTDLRLLRVSDVSQSPITIQESAPTSLAIRLLLGHRIGALPVVDTDERLVGIISYVDVLARSMPGMGISEHPLAVSAREGVARGVPTH